MNRARREFLADVGRGMLVATVGPALAADLGLAAVRADDVPARLSFGALEPLVGLMQDTPAGKLQPLLVERLKAGAALRDLVAAAALANARTLGGHDYDGYHTFMALAPALEMARELPEARRPLPILKVLYCNAAVLQRWGGSKRETLRAVEPATLPDGRRGGEVLREATRGVDVPRADGVFVALAGKSLPDAYDDLQLIVQDEVNVHRVVLAWRAWEMLDVTGKDQAATLLRQSVHFCVQSERARIANRRPDPVVRSVLPKLLDQYKLVGKPLGDRRGDDAWVEPLAQAVYAGNPSQAAEAVAAALAEGFAPASVAEAISLAANRLVLCDVGRRDPVGAKSRHSVHGDSVGVHASDAANAWRHIARVGSPRNAVASMVAGAFHTGGQSAGQLPYPYPHAAHLEAVTAKEADALLRQAEEAIRANDQALACAVVRRYGDLGHAPRPILDVLLRFAISEDGALHAEKYYRTATEEFAAMRPAFRWRQLVALARVTASEYGQPAPGYAEACELLRV